MLKIPGYTVTKIVYEDSFILVAYARSEKTGKTMLIKVVKEGTRTTIENAKLIHEYHFLSELKMDGLFRPLSYMTSKTMMVLEFEPIEAVTAREYILTGDSSPLGLIKMLERAASRLQMLHDRGILHLNIRPDTLLIQERTEDVYLTGFGYAVRLDQLELQGHSSLEGNPVYMSPEQTGRMSHRLDVRADIYSLGVTFYELLSKRLPFTAKGALEWAHAHLAQQPQPLHALNRDIPPWVSDIVMKMLAKDPDERYPSMQVIVEKIIQSGIAVEREKDTERFIKGRSPELSAFVTVRQNSGTELAPQDKEERTKASLEAASMSLSGHIVSYPQVLDLAAVIQASQIFTTETTKERTAERFLQLIVMNAGAHRGLMLTTQNHDWYIEAEAELKGQRITAFFKRTRIEEPHHVRMNLLQRSIETKGVVQSQAAVKECPRNRMAGLTMNAVTNIEKGSVLYLPVIIQDQVLGVLYLENHLIPKPFISERFHVLRNLASQALFAIRANFQPDQPHSQVYLKKTEDHADHRTYDLTKREKEVLRLVSKGFSNKEIAAALTIANETVKSHIKKIFEKLKVDRRVKAAAVANALGLLEEDANCEKWPSIGKRTT